MGLIDDAQSLQRAIDAEASAQPLGNVRSQLTAADVAVGWAIEHLSRAGVIAIERQDARSHFAACRYCGVRHDGRRHCPTGLGTDTDPA